ncbi:acyltransferase [Billgrantia gudaonensis]|uniref:Acyltransferase n=1 Tax=Billgrantia gudaonensis TaxID=376427 RepID=A0A3S0NX72_9GAMM|nr:acyltransferase [Halomonas gudaonensis]
MRSDSNVAKGRYVDEPGEIREKMIEAHLPMIDDAASQGVQVLCFQEVFTQPYFCPSQDKKWYDSAEKIPDGPTTKLMGVCQEASHGHRGSDLRRRHARCVLQHCSSHRCDGSYLGKYRKNHIPTLRRASGKSFKPGNCGYPVFDTAYCKLGVYICYDRHFRKGGALLHSMARSTSSTLCHRKGQEPLPLGWSSRHRPPPMPSSSARSHRRARSAMGRANGDFYGSSYIVNPMGRSKRRPARTRTNFVHEIDLT